MSEDEMAGQPHQLSGREFEQTPGGSEGTGKPHEVEKCQTQLSDSSKD